MKFAKTFLILIAFASLTPSRVLADHEEIICPQPYGNGVVCGTKTHEPVDTAFGDNPVALAGSLLLASGLLLFVSKKKKASIAI